MLFPEEDAPQLKKWIVHRLENTSDADADVLADYVLALLRHDGDVQAVRQLCEDEIPDFLKEDSSIFVRDLFDAMQYRSYLPGASQPPKQPALSFQQPVPPLAPSYGNLVPAGAPRGPQNGSRKRTFNESGDGNMQDRGGFETGGDMNGRSFKQPRRGGSLGRGGYNTNSGYDRGLQQNQPPQMQIPGLGNAGFQDMLAMPSPPPGMPPLDPNNPMAAFLAMQAMGFPVPGMPPFPQSIPSTGNTATPRPHGQRSQRCRDYDTKGYCARGNSCKFDHGNDATYVPPVSADEYDPNNSSMMPGIESSAPKSFSHSPRGGFVSMRGDRGRGPGRGQRGDRGGGSSRGRGGRAEFSSDRPNFDRTKTTIVVENIPEEKFTEEDVREFFSEFGMVTEVTMKPYKRLALVKYEDWNAAKAAYSSPNVIFDNRFVKVYWYTNDESLPQAPAGSKVSGAPGSQNGTIAPVPARENSEPQIDMEEFARKQDEAQKSHVAKMKKKAEMEAAQKELEQRQEELIKKQAEEKRKLMERIAAKSGKSNASPAPDQETLPSSNTKPSSQTEALKAQLAALEAEAKSLGLDPSAADDSSWGGRGRGRGRGGFRGRGTFAPRGRGFDRGGYRGRGGPSFGTVNPYKLDNRPKKIALTGIDFTIADKEETLRQHLLGIGEFTDLEVTPSRTSITFKDRFTAEKLMYGGEIPPLGMVEMAWVQTPLPPVSLAKPVGGSAEKVNSNDDSSIINEDDGDAMAGTKDSVATSAGGHGGHVGQRLENQELDYDVADDNEWGAM